MQDKTLGTILTAMVSPFSASGGVDLETTRQTAALLTRPGWNDGLVVNGTTGESAMTSDGEKGELLRAAKDGARNARIIAGVGSADTAHSVRLARQAEQAGADGLLVVSPYYMRPSQAGILAHFRAIADATSLPVMLYDIPQRTGIELSSETILEAARHPNIVALKDANGDLEKASWMIKDSGLDYYSGEDALNLPFLAIGAVGLVSVVGHVAADQLRRMTDLAFAGNLEGAGAIHRHLLQIFSGIFRAPGAASAKAALEMMGLPVGKPRLPLLGLTDSELDLLRKDLSHIGALAATGADSARLAAADRIRIHSLTDWTVAARPS